MMVKEFWPANEAVAAALMDRKRLTEGEVRRIMREAMR
jgi:hypothetical protein